MDPIKGTERRILRWDATGLVNENEVSGMISSGDLVSTVSINLDKHDLATTTDANGKQKSDKEGC